MKRACHNFLTCSGLAANENADVGWADTLDHALDFRHLRRSKHNTIESRPGITEPIVLFFEAPHPQSARDGNPESIDVDGFLEEIERSLCDRLNCAFPVSVTTCDNNFGSRGVGEDVLQCLQAFGRAIFIRWQTEIQ